MQEILNKLNSIREEVVSYFSALEAESDRGHALISTPYLENALKSLISEKFLKDHKETSQLFKRSLKSFASRIDFAFCLGLLDSNVRDELHLIRTIRNEFAHTATELSFENDIISKNVERLAFSLDRGATTQREKFESSVLISFMILSSYMTLDHNPVLEKDKLYPTEEGMDKVFSSLAERTVIMEDLLEGINELNDSQHNETQ